VRGGASGRKGSDSAIKLDASRGEDERAARTQIRTVAQSPKSRHAFRDAGLPPILLHKITRRFWLKKQPGGGGRDDFPDLKKRYLTS